MRIFTILKKLCTKTKVDYIISQGISGIWFYRKWASGYCELYGCGTATAKYVQTWNGLQHYEVSVNLPFSVNSGRMFYNSQVATGFGISANQSGTTWDGAKLKVTLVSLGSQKGGSFGYTIHIWGKWK